jgi:hypothetical protein
MKKGFKASLALAIISLSTLPVLGQGFVDINSYRVQPYHLKVAKGGDANVVVFEKFGKNPVINTTSDPEDVWAAGGEFTGFPTGAAETMEIYSSVTNDTAAGSGARTVTIYNLLNADGESMPNLVVSLLGTNQVVISTNKYYRGGSRIRVTTAGSEAGNVGVLTLRHTATTANVFATVPVQLNSTSIAAYTVPVGKTLYLDRVQIYLARASGAAGSASISVRARAHGGVFAAVFDPEISPRLRHTTIRTDILYFQPEQTLRSGATAFRIARRSSWRSSAAI